MATPPATDRVEAAAAMFIYGYPLVYSLAETAGFTGGHSSAPVEAPWNQFGYARELLGPETTFVSPNNDTLYVLAALDLRPGPLVLHVPDTGDRYHVLQFVDTWTNNFAYIGRRTTGTTEQRFLLLGPGDDTDAQEGMQIVRAPTGVAPSSAASRSTGRPTRPRCTRSRTSSRSRR